MMATEQLLRLAMFLEFHGISFETAAWALGAIVFLLVVAALYERHIRIGKTRECVALSAENWRLRNANLVSGRTEPEPRAETRAADVKERLLAMERRVLEAELAAKRTELQLELLRKKYRAETGREPGDGR